jgi:hypothetical protein
MADPAGDAGGRVPTSTGPAWLPPTWPVTVVVPGLVVWWALGLAPFVRFVVIVPMALRLLATRRVRIPAGFGVWMLFLGLVALSGLQVEPARIVLFAFHAGEYVAAGVFLLYVHDLAVRDPGVTARVRRSLVHAWYLLVGTGWLAILVPTLTLPSLSQSILPARLATDPWVTTLTTPAVAQVQDFLGFPIPRPAAPYVYTNGWGSAFALLFPLVVLTAIRAAPRQRRVARWGLVLSVAPAVMSANRAMWASLAAGLLYLVFAAREAPTRRALRRAAAIVSIGTLLLLVGTPLGGIVIQRVDTPHSNSARLDLAVAAGDLVAESPLVGHALPQPWDGPGIRPPVGTQGQLWTLLVSHGIPATLAFVGFFIVIYRRMASDRSGLWGRAALVAAAVQLPFYELSAGQLTLLTIMAGLALADTARRSSP